MVNDDRKQAKKAEYKARQAQYKLKYDALNMKTFSVKIRLELNEQLEKHIANLKMDDKSANRNRFVTEAILEKLERDSNGNIENMVE